MNELQNVKVVQVIAPAAAVNNASFTTIEVDSIGFDYATFVFELGATDIALTALKLQHSATAGSGHADIDGLDFDGDTDIDGSAASLPSATDDNKVFILQTDLRSKNRYLDLVATVGNGTTGAFASCVCILSKGEQSPTTKTQMNAGGVLRTA